MMSMGLLFNRFKKEGTKGERIGQFFCDRFLKEPWSELYHEDDQGKAVQMIEAWLASHHYIDSLPPVVPSHDER